MATPSLHHTWTAATAVVTLAIVASLAPFLAAPSAQTVDARPAFEAVSIKENKSGPSSAGGDRFSTVFFPGGRFTARNATLKDLVLTAYRNEFPSAQVSGFTGWMVETRFDVEARAQAGDMRQLQLMVQSLLADRFTLRVRREARSEDVHVLSVASGGHKLRPAKEADACADSTEQGRPRASQCHMLKVGGTGLDGVAVNTADIAGALQFFLQRPVIDRAKLPGLYEVSAQWKPQGAASKDPDLYTAIREQLGLTLDLERRPIPTLIVESAQPPRN